MLYNIKNMYFSNFTKKGLALFGILFIIISTTPKLLNAQAAVVSDPVTETETAATAVVTGTTAVVSTYDKIKKNILDPLAWALAKKTVAGLTAQTVNWINSGFNGNPGYLTDPAQFFLNIGDNVASDYISRDPRLNSLCTPFKAEVKIALVKNHLLESQGQSSSCTLSKIKDNFEGFLNDFSQGGWEGWFEVTQSDQGNPYGAYLAAQDMLSVKIGNQKSKYQKQIDLGGGILSFEKCKKGSILTQEMVDGFVGPTQDNTDPNFVGPTEEGIIESGQYKGYKVGDCINNDMETVTPGSVINDSLKKALGSGIDQLNLADSFNEIIGALATNLFSRVVGGNGGGGLKGAGNKNSLLQNTISYQESKPIITLIGPKIINVQVGLRFDDPGAIASDSVDGDISEYIQTSGILDTSKVGTYELTYNVSNSQGIPAKTEKRTINVMVDVSAPAAICSAVSNGRGNDPGAPTDPVDFEKDFANVVFDQSEISNWTKKAQLTGVDANNTTISFDYKTVDTWPLIQVGNMPPPNTFGSAWVLVWRYENFPDLVLSSTSVAELREFQDMLNQQKLAIESILSKLIEYNSAKDASNVDAEIRNLFSYSYTYTLPQKDSQGRVSYGYEKGVIQSAIDERGYVDELLLTKREQVMIDFISAQESYWQGGLGELINLKQEYDNAGNGDPVKLTYGLKFVPVIRNVPPLISSLIARIDRAIYIADSIAKGKTSEGSWHAYPFTYMTSQTRNDFKVDSLFCADPNFKPTEGDTYGFMISTPANNTNALNKKQRSNIFAYKWPAITRVAPPQTPRIPPPPPTGGDACQLDPNAEERKQSQDALDFMMPLLNAIPVDNPLMTTPTPPSANYQSAVQNIVDQVNSRYPLVKAAYAGTEYVKENTIAMVWTYVVGPVSASSGKISNQLNNSQTIWQSAWRVTSPTCPGSGGGGGGRCADPGNTTPNYRGAVMSARDAVIANNPSLASSMNTMDNSRAFTSQLASQLQGSGYQASSRVLSGNDVLHTENYVVVWRSGDSAMERYEVVNNAGDGNTTIQNATTNPQYSGDIPLSCTQ